MLVSTPTACTAPGRLCVPVQRTSTIAVVGTDNLRLHLSSFLCIVLMVNLEMHLPKASERSLNPRQITWRGVRTSPLLLQCLCLSRLPTSCRPPLRRGGGSPRRAVGARGGRVGQHSCCRVRCRAESGDTVLRSPSNTTSLFSAGRGEAGVQLFASASSGGAATVAAGVPARGCIMSCI